MISSMRARAVSALTLTVSSPITWARRESISPACRASRTAGTRSARLTAWLTMLSAALSVRLNAAATSEEAKHLSWTMREASSSGLPPGHSVTSATAARRIAA